MNNTIQSNRYNELDALRGIAALMVVFFHFTMDRPQGQLGFKLGVTGVDLFFIISGFVIFMSLTKAKSSIDFVINRVSRLYPTYWASVTFTFLLFSFFAIYDGWPEQIDFKRYFGNMTMFQFYLKITDLDGPYWTMIIEMLFYMGILFLFHFKMLKYLKKIGLDLSVLVVIVTSYFYENSTVQYFFKWIPLLPFIPLFFAGTIFYKLYTNKSKLLENYTILIICLICQILLYKYAGRSKGSITHIEYGLMLTLYFTLFTLFVNGKLKFIVSKGTLFLGKISFALYLIHQYISIGVMIPLLINRFHLNFWIASLCITLPTIITIAWFITEYIGTPMSNRMKEKLRKITAPQNEGLSA